MTMKQNHHLSFTPARQEVLAREDVHVRRQTQRVGFTRTILPWI